MLLEYVVFSLLEGAHATCHRVRLGWHQEAVSSMFPFSVIGMSKITLWIVWSGLYPHPVWLFPSLSLRAEAVIWPCLLPLLLWQSPFLLQASVLIPKTELLSYWSSGHKSHISRRNKGIWDVFLCCWWLMLLLLFLITPSDLLIVSMEWLPLRGDVCGFRIFWAFIARLILPGLSTCWEHKIHIWGGFLCLTILLCFVTCKLRLVSASEGAKIISPICWRKAVHLE